MKPYAYYGDRPTAPWLNGCRFPARFPGRSGRVLYLRIWDPLDDLQPIRG